MDFWLLSEFGCQSVAASGAAVIIVQFLLTVIHLITSAAGSIGGTAERSKTEGGRKINSMLRTGCDCPASMIHVLSSIPWTSTAQRPGIWPTGFSLRSRRLSDISVIYKETAFGLFFQELLLLAFL